MSVLKCPRTSITGLAVFCVASLVACARSGYSESDPAQPLGRGVVSLAARGSFTCALTKAGGVWCWGYNGHGQLGVGSEESMSREPQPVSGLDSGNVAITAGDNFACALDESANVHCWGKNGSGQLGDGTTESRGAPALVQGLPGIVTELGAGGEHLCAVLEDGQLACWGSNSHGQLGDNTTSDSLAPLLVAGIPGVVQQVAAGSYHTCVLLADGTIWCWGLNYYGQVGDGTGIDRPNPTAVVGLAGPAVTLAAGEKSNCAVIDDGTIQCWGYNGFGQIGDGTFGDATSPRTVIALPSHATEVALGVFHTCARSRLGEIHCWGRNWAGQLGDGTHENRAQPVVLVGAPRAARRIVAGADHSCALALDGTVVCWGSSANGELGLAVEPYQATPRRVTTVADDVAGVAAGGNHTCLLTQSGAVRCFGYNGDGRLGDGGDATSSREVMVTGLSGPIAKVASGGGFNCALSAEGGLQCWGSDGGGALGNGPEDGPGPTAVVGLTSGVSDVSLGESHGCALLSSRAMKCWGDNGDGQLGNGTTTREEAPIDVVLPAGVAAVALGGSYGHTCAALDDGTAWCWGHNYYGQLGNGAIFGDDELSPVQVQNLGTALTALGAGQYHTCGLTAAGGVKCWGYGYHGELGNGTVGASALPVAVLGLEAGVAQLSVGGWHNCVLTQSGGVKCWGNNSQGQLGIGNDENRSVPTDVPGLGSGVLAVSAGGNHTCAVTAAREVFCWGSGSDGQIGDPAAWSERPVRIVGLGP